jgi:uncharacterized protein YggL (DUF469 family)
LCFNLDLFIDEIIEEIITEKRGRKKKKIEKDEFFQEITFGFNVEVYNKGSKKTTLGQILLEYNKRDER